MATKEYHREWYKNNVEKCRAKSRRYRVAHQDKVNAYSKSYYESHPEYFDKKHQEYVAVNHAEMIEKKREYNKENRLELREARKEHYHKDIKKSRMDGRLYKHNNRSRICLCERMNYKKNIVSEREKARLEYYFRKFAGGIELTAEIIQFVYERNIKMHGTLTCYLCHKPIVFGNDNLEHKTPPCRGGSNHPDNLDVAHASCNQSKGSMTYEECLASKLFSL